MTWKELFQWRPTLTPKTVAENTVYWPRLSTLPSTNWKLFVTSFVFVYAVWKTFDLIERKSPIDVVILGMVYGLILSMAGIETTQFIKKRTTSKEHMDGMAAIEEAKKAPPPVVVAAPVPPVPPANTVVNVNPASPPPEVV